MGPPTVHREQAPSLLGLPDLWSVGKSGTWLFPVGTFDPIRIELFSCAGIGISGTPVGAGDSLVHVCCQNKIKVWDLPEVAGRKGPTAIRGHPKDGSENEAEQKSPEPTEDASYPWMMTADPPPDSYQSPFQDLGSNGGGESQHSGPVADEVGVQEGGRLRWTLDGGHPAGRILALLPEAGGRRLISLGSDRRVSAEEGPLPVAFCSANVFLLNVRPPGSIADQLLAGRALPSED